MILTRDQPAYWSVLTGVPGPESAGSGPVPPFWVLDPGSPPGRPAMDGTNDRVLRGYAMLFAIDPPPSSGPPAGDAPGHGGQIRWNHLAGNTTIVDYQRDAAWSFPTWTVAVANPNVSNGEPIGTPGVLNLDGYEYAFGFARLELDFQAAGSTAFSSTSSFVQSDSDLTLHPLEADYRQGGTPVTTKADILVWNENETKLSGNHKCVTCWDQSLLSIYHLPETAPPAVRTFVLEVLQTDHGKARINGVSSSLCDFDFDPNDGPLGADPRDIVSEDAALLGVSATLLAFDRGDLALGGSTLVGMGTQTARITWMPQLATGACCFADETCTEGVPDECTSAGGLYQGHGTTCTAGACELPAGACCLPDGSCTQADTLICLGAGGVFQGEASFCSFVECPASGCAQDLNDDGVIGFDDLLTVLSLWGFCPTDAQLPNGSFETGDFAAWIPQDIFDPFEPLTVGGAGFTPWDGFFLSEPTDGSFAAWHGFDGAGPGMIRLAQDVFVPTGATDLEFDFRAAWDLQHPDAFADRALVESAPMPEPPTDLRPSPGLIPRLLKLTPAEVQPVLWSCACFFFLLSGYFVLRPVRDAMALTGGVRDVPKLFMVTLLAMLLLNPVFSALVSRFPRRVFIPVLYLFIIASLAVFYVVFRARAGADDVYIARAFYIWVSVINIFLVSVFWGLMADLFQIEQSKRLFGLIGVGGTLGAIAGLSVASAFARLIGEINVLPISIGLLLIACSCVLRINKIVRRRVPPLPSGEVGEGSEPGEGSERGEGEPRDAPDDRRIGGSAFAGIINVLRSPYLLLVCLYLVLYSSGSTIIYFQKIDLVDQLALDRAHQTQVFGLIELATQILTVIVQIFFTGRLIPRLGVGATLALLPAVSIVGFLCLGIAPLLGVLVVFEVVRRATNFALAKPARESLYTVVPREEKYKAKSLIDTFVYRAGDGSVAVSWAFLTGPFGTYSLATFSFAAWRLGWLPAPIAGLSLATMSLLAAPLAVLWLVIALVLGRMQKRLAKARE